MPKYKVNGRTYNLPEDKVEDFLIEYPEAVSIDEEEGKLEDVVVKDATVTSEPEPASESMELESVDTSLVSEDSKPTIRKGRAQVRQEELQRVDVVKEQKKIEDSLEQVELSDTVFTNLPDSEKIKLQDIAVDQISLDYKSQGVEEYDITPEEVDIKATEILKEKNRPSVVKSYAAQAVRGFSSFAKGLSELGETIQYSLVETALDAFDPDYKGTVEEKQAIMGIVKGGGLQAPGSAKLPPSSEIGVFIEKLEPSIRKYEASTITEDIEKGNYLQAGERAVGAAIESLPSLVAAATGAGGLVLLGGSVSGSKFMEEFEADPEKSTGVLLANAGLTGVTEASFELVTRGILSKARLLKDSGADKAARDLIRGGSEKLITSLGLNTLKEGGSEAATKVTTLLLDQLTLGKDIDWEKEAYNIIDEGIVGGIMGSGTTFAGAIANTDKAVVERAQMILTPSENKQQLVKSANNISKLYKDAKSADAEGVKLINEAIKSEELNIVEIKKQTAEALNNMTPSELKVYANNQNELRKLQQQIKDPKTSDSVRDLANNKFVKLRDENDVLFRESGERRIQRGVEVITEAAEKVEGVEVQSFDTTQEVEDFIKQQDPEADLKASEQQGFIIQNPTTGEQTIVVNKEVAGKEKAMNIAGHEFGHAILFKTVKDSPETAVNLGKALLSEINKIDATQVKDSKFKRRLEQYSKAPESVKMEEAITLFSDALATGDIKFNENVFTKIGDQIRRIMQSLGVKVKFNTGRDVYNFVKDYNRSIEKGKIGKAQIKAAKEGVKGALVQEAVTEAETIIKESKSEEASQEVQKIYEEQGVAGAFEILEKFKPITNKLVERRSQAPNFDRQLLTDEIETGKRGIFDLIREYKPESGVPLAAYINKYLPARAIEASNRVLGEEFTEDVTEARGVVAEAAPAEVVEERVTRKIKPSSLISSDAVSKIKEQVAEKIKEIPADKLTFKKLGDLAPEIIAEEIGIPVKKLVDPKANLSKGDASAIQRFVNKNADKLLKILPEGAVLEAATEKLMGTSTGVPKGLLNAFYTKQKRIGTAAGLAPFTKNADITKADFLRAFGIVEGKKAEDFSARSPQAQALKGMANLYGRLVTNEIARAETDLDIETKQDIAAGKSRLMFSKASDINENLTKNNKNYRRFRNSILNKDMFHGGSKTISTEATWFYLDDPEAAEMWGDGKVYKTNSSLLTDQLIIPDLNDVSEYHKHASKKFGLPEENFFDVRNIMKLPNAGEIINDWIDWVTKNKTEWDLGYNLYEQGSLTEGIAVTVIGEIPKSKLELLKEDVVSGKSRVMFSKAIEKSTNKEFLNKELSNEQKVSINNSVKDVLIGKNTKDALMIELNDSILRKVGDSKNMRQVLEAMFSEPEKLLSRRQARELQAKLITAVQDGFSQDQSARSLVYSAAKSIKTFFKYQREIIGYGYVKNKLKQDLKSAKTAEQKAQLVKEFLVFSSRSIRTSKIDGITTNKAIFDKIIQPLVDSDNSLKNFEVFTKKGRSYITYKGNVVKGLSSIYDIKNNFAENIGVIDLEADISREYIIKQIDEARRNNDIDGVIAMLALLTSDQRGALRKSSKAGFYVDDARVKNYILEHEMEAYEIHKAYVNYAKDGDINKLDNILNESYVNSIPKSLDDILNVKGVKERNIDRYKRPEFVEELQKLDDKGLLKNIDRSRYGIKFSKAENLEKTFNDILEKKSGIPSKERYGIVEAIVKGSNKGRFKFFIPPSAEDFVGLLYGTLGKGKLGDAQMGWYKKNLIDPYAEAMNKLSMARIYLINNYKTLKSQLKIVPKNLAKKVPGKDYTIEQAVRVYIWNKQKMDIPGISDKEVRGLVELVASDENLQVFADQLINLQFGDKYVKPKVGWPAGTITTDLLEGLNTTKRSKYLKKWQENVDAIFNESSMNKLQAIYGEDYRAALENMLSRMKSGRNRSFPGDSTTGKLVDWLSGSVGAIMFFNTRSAILQTISSINFINFTDNNILAAGKAFANQKQYWSDFMELMNSDFLKERRGGLRINVNEADIADMAKKGGVQGAISKLLELGFAPTQIADSFAIASGGATFYRNRIKTYKKQGLSDKEAEKRAFEDFRETAEESQQSSRPDRISMQQAGPLGRVILAFANTPAQYARIIKKAVSDLKNGRGDAKTNISKIIYYGAVQNLIFNTLQQALFAFAFGDAEPEDEEKEKKYIGIANGMLDSLLRGLGIGGAAVSVGKNALIRIYNELKKKNPKLEKVGYELTKFSPPISAKLSKMNQAARSYQWEKEEMMSKGLSLDNPAYLAGANVISALTNVPLDRVVKKANNVVQATTQDLEMWERLALLGGWQDWEIGIKEEKPANKPQPRKVKKKERKEKKRREIIR